MPYENIRKLLKAFDEAENGEMIGIPVGVLPLLDKLERKLKYFHHSKTIIISNSRPRKGEKMDKKEETYEVPVHCTNCHQYQTRITISCGMPVKDYLAKHQCPVCKTCSVVFGIKVYG